MAIIAIESALDVAITFGDTELVKIYQEALADAGVDYVSTAKSWMEYERKIEMKSLLMLFGYSAYQAGCIAPMMWVFVIGAVAVGVAEWKGWLN